MSGSSPATILVVEDERGLADLYSEWLASEYSVETAYTGESALEQLGKPFDVILLDRRMPGLSGDQVLDRIRDQDIDSRVVIVSAVEPDFDVIALGFDDYLVKPVSKEDLIDAVERMQKRLDYDRELQRYFALVSKKATLEVEKREEELEDNEEYLELVEELEGLRERVDNSLTALDQTDLRAVLRDTVQGSSSPSSES